jgi:hypothetical protein
MHFQAGKFNQTVLTFNFVSAELFFFFFFFFFIYMVVLKLGVSVGKAITVADNVSLILDAE